MSDDDDIGDTMETEQTTDTAAPVKTHITIKSELFNEPYRIPITEFNRIRTVGQLKQYLDQNAAINNSAADLRHYVVKAVTSEGTTDMDDTDTIDMTELGDLQGMILVVRQLSINVIDRGERYEALLLPVTAAVSEVRGMLPYDKQTQLERFTHRGQRVNETDTLYNVGLVSGELYDDPDNTLFHYDNINWRSCLTGLIRLYVKDDLANIETPVDVYDDSDVLVVIRQYETVAKRMLLPGSTLIAQGDVNALQQGRTLYEQHIVDETILVLTTPDFVVNISEMKQSAGQASGMPKVTPITVYDYYTVRRVKEEYNKINAGLEDALTGADKLFYGTDEIEDNRKLYTHNIRPTIGIDGMLEPPTVLLRREEIKMNVAVYLCANCGNDVALKRSDTVQCQTCFERILYKKPKPTPRQYICR